MKRIWMLALAVVLVLAVGKQEKDIALLLTMAVIGAGVLLLNKRRVF